MNDEILNSVKKICNILEDDHSFDQELIMYTNSALMIVMQEWYGMDHALRLEDGTETWDELLGEDTDYEAVKELVGLKVRLMFDPPTNSTHMQAITDQIKDLEWRMFLWKDNQRLDDESSK